MPAVSGLGGGGASEDPTTPWAGGLGGVQLGGGFYSPVEPPLPLCVEACAQTALNAVEVRLGSAQPIISDPFGPNDALNPRNYQIIPVSPPNAVQRRVQWTEKIDDFTVRLLLDGPLDGDATYQVVATNILSVDCSPLGPCNVCTLLTFLPPRAPDAVRAEDDRALDLANPQLTSDAKQRDGTDAPLGTFQINKRGDLALESNPQYLRKRVIRRATTGLGEFFHLPNYGFGQPLKGKLTISQLRRIQGAAIRQIKQEPDVRYVAVRVRQVSEQNPNVIVLEIQVEDTSGRRENYTVPLDFGAGAGGV